MSHPDQHFSTWFLVAAALIWAAAWLAGPSALGALVAAELTRHVRPDESTYVIAVAELTGCASSPPCPTFLVDFSAPLHGALLQAGDELLFTPDDSFWTLGTDSFSFTIADIDTDPQGAATGSVLLVANLFGSEGLAVDFENGQSPYETSEPAAARVESEAAIAGAYGLRVDPTVTVQSDAFFHWTRPAPIGDHLGDGDGDNNGGQGSVKIRAPSTGGKVPPEGGEVEILTVGSPSGSHGVRLVLRDDAESVVLDSEIMDDEQVAAGREGIPFGDGAHELRIGWWRSITEPTYASGGLLVWLDGDLVHRVAAIDNGSGELTHVRFGLMSPPAPLTSFLDFDDVEVRAGPNPVPAYSELKRDGFEAGNLARWDNAATTGLVVSPTAALTGRWGLEVDVSAVESFVVDASPSIVASYRARFRIDTKGLLMAPEDTFLIFGGLGQDGLAAAYSNLQLWLQFSAGGYWLQAHHKPDCGPRQTTDWIPITDGQHTVELRWRAASRPEERDGRLAFGIDGETKAILDRLDNAGEVIDSILLGAIGVDAGTSGILAIDNFEAWR